MSLRWRQMLCRVLGCRDRLIAGYVICLRCNWMSRVGRR